MPTSVLTRPAPGPAARPRPRPAPVAPATVRTRVRTRVPMPEPLRRRRRRMRRAGVGLLLGAAVIVVAGVWLVITALLAKGRLSDVRADLETLHSQIAHGDLAGARATARTLADHAAAAHELTTGPVWAVASGLPGFQAVRTVRTVTTQVDVLSHVVLPRLITASRLLDPATLRGADGSIDVARIARVAPLLDSAAGRLDAALAAVAAEPAQSGVGGVDDARTRLLGELNSLSHTVHSAGLAARITPDLLGAQGTRRYFVAFQNEAEARGTGGLPGAFAILRADHGRIGFERFGTDADLVTARADVDFGGDYRQLFGRGRTTEDFRNANISPHFPYAASIWVRMWQQHTGERLDGAMAVDPTVLSYLLQATGPAPLPGGGHVGADNVVALTQQQVYARFPTDQLARRQFLLEVARVATERVATSHADPAALVRAGARAAGERRLLVYSTHPDLQREIARTSLAGALPGSRASQAPYAGLAVTNDGGNKLDYYLDRSLTWARSGCGATRTVTATVTLHNGAPVGLPRYVRARSDRPGYATRPGDNRLLVSYYATSGASLTAVTLDGRPVIVRVDRDRGHPVYTLEVEVPRAATRTLVLTLREPAGSGAVQVLRQPGVRPLHATVSDGRCG